MGLVSRQLVGTRRLTTRGKTSIPNSIGLGQPEAVSLLEHKCQ